MTSDTRRVHGVGGSVHDARARAYDSVQQEVASLRAHMSQFRQGTGGPFGISGTLHADRSPSAVGARHSSSLADQFDIHLVPAEEDGEPSAVGASAHRGRAPSPDALGASHHGRGHSPIAVGGHHTHPTEEDSEGEGDDLPFALSGHHSVHSEDSEEEDRDPDSLHARHSHGGPVRHGPRRHAPPGEIHIGTHGKGGFVEKHRTKATNPDRVAAEQAFADFRAEVADIYDAEGKDLLSMLVLNRKKLIKLKVQTGRARPKEIELTLGQLKDKMTAYRVRMGRGRITRAQVRRDVEQDIENYYRAFDRILKKERISPISHYSASGKDVRGSAIKKPALATNHANPRSLEGDILRRKQTQDLVLGAKRGLSEEMGFMKKRGWTARDRGPLSFIGRIQGVDDVDTIVKQKKAVDQALRAEAFLIKLREKLSEKIEALKEDMRAEADEEARNELREKYFRFMKLRDQLLNETNRHALYATAVYGDPEECYKAIFNDLYEEYYADVEPIHKPSISEFTKSTASAPMRRYAAEVASSLIADARAYRKFCQEFGIPPTKNPINLFINEALAEANPEDARDRVDFANLDIDFEGDENDDIEDMVVEAREAVDEPFGFGFGADPDVARINVIAGSKTPAERLKAALEDEELRPLLEDPHTIQKGTIQKIRDWWNS